MTKNEKRNIPDYWTKGLIEYGVKMNYIEDTPDGLKFVGTTHQYINQSLKGLKKLTNKQLKQSINQLKKGNSR